MIVYILCFITSLFLFSIAPRIKKQQRILIIAIALIIPCMLAASRDDTIGTDVQVYLRPIYEAAEQSLNFGDYLGKSWFHIYKYNKISDYEFGFIFVVYIVTKIFHNIASVKFVIEFLVLYPIYIAFKKYCEEVPIWMGIGTFYLLFYNQSFNLMRQYIAVGFLFLGIIGYLKKEDTKHYLIFQFFALLFHSSALAGIPIFIIARYLKNSDMQYSSDVSLVKGNKYTDKKGKVFFLSMVGIGILLTFGVVSKVLSLLGLGRYIGYVAGELSFMPNQILIRLPIIAMCFWGWNKLVYKYSNTEFLVTMLIYTIVFSQFAGASTFGARIAVYFAVFQILLIPRILCSNLLKSRINICSTLLGGYLIFYWYYFYVLLGMDATIPFLVAH